jgi:hypothetical protein
MTLYAPENSCQHLVNIPAETSNIYLIKKLLTALLMTLCMLLSSPSYIPKEEEPLLRCLDASHISLCSLLTCHPRRRRRKDQSAYPLLYMNFNFDLESPRASTCLAERFFRQQNSVHADKCSNKIRTQRRVAVVEKY